MIIIMMINDYGPGHWNRHGDRATRAEHHHDDSDARTDCGTGRQRRGSSSQTGFSLKSDLDSHITVTRLLLAFPDGGNLAKLLTGSLADV